MKKLILPITLCILALNIAAQDQSADGLTSEQVSLITGNNNVWESIGTAGSPLSNAAGSPAMRRRVRYAFDYGFGVGPSNYLGEMGGKQKTRRDFIADMKLKETRWAVSGFARYKFNNYIAVQSSITYLRIQGDDKLSTNRGRKGRNLSFRNDMFEIGARADAYIYGVNDVGGTGRYRLDFKTYIFAGAAAVFHSPKTTYDGGWVKLRPLMTEGVKYSKVAFAVPVGVGMYFTKKRKYRFGFEAGWRISFTDYLDDVSNVYVDHTGGSPQAIALANRRPELGNDASVPGVQNYTPGSKRGDPSHNDTYFYALFTYSYVLRGRNTFYTQNYNWLFGKRGRHRLVRVKF